MKKNTEIASFGAGCFWGVEYIFSKTKGVVSTEVGYMGGDLKNPKYEDVCRHDTGHAEVVKIEFDSRKVSYGELLEIFWKNHNPTTLNRQGPDVGTQYRSVIFYYNLDQKNKAIISKENYQKKLGDKKIVTQIVPAKEFYRAEEYHQKYLEKNGRTFCHVG